jgi:UDP-glucose 4-epimerase
MAKWITSATSGSTWSAWHSNYIYYVGKTVVVTGVAGFIGSRVAARMAAEGFTVIGVDDLSSGKQSNVPSSIDFIQGNLADTQTISKLPKSAEFVLHLAGQSSGEMSFDDPVADLEKNTISTLNLIKYGIGANTSKFVYASSMSVYGNVPDAPIGEDEHVAPLSCYGVGKLAAENYLNVFGKQLSSVSLRMFNVYGPGQDMTNLRQGMVSIYLAQALTNKHIVVKGSLERFRDFIYIDDVVDAWFRAATFAGVVGNTINIGTGVRTTVAQVLEAVKANVVGTTVEVTDPTPGDQNGIFADTTRMRALLGMSDFVQLADGVKRFSDFVKTV